MNEKNNGGAAFATQHTVADANDPCFKFGQPGMTLRDYFAAKAMQAFVSRGKNEFPASEYDDGIARWAYETADAMIRARGEA